MESATQRLYRQVKRSGHRVWMRRLVRLTVTAFVFMLISSFLRAGWALWRLKREEAQLRVAVQVLQEQNRTLRAQLEAMKGDAYIRQAARQLGLVNPGEVLYLPAPPQSGSPAGP